MRRRRGQGPHLAKRWEPRGFSPFSQIFPPSPSPPESIRLFYTSVSLLLSRTQGYCYHLSKFHEEGNPAGLSSCSGGLRPLVELCVEPAGLCGRCTGTPVTGSGPTLHYKGSPLFHPEGRKGSCQPSCDPQKFPDTPGSLEGTLSRIREGNGNPLQCCCLENPRDGGAQTHVY